MGATISSFQQLTGKRRRIVELKYEGESHQRIADAVGLSKSRVDHLLAADGELRPVFVAYADHMADQALAEAQSLIRSLAPKAIATLHELSQPPHPPHVRVAASKALASGLLGSKELAKLPAEPSITSSAITAEIDRIILASTS